LKKNINKKILITAGNSNIGSDLVNYFLKKNYNVFETYRLKKNKLTHKKLSHSKFDFKNKFKLAENFDLLIHSASLTPYKHKISRKKMALNLEGLKKIIYSNCNFKNIVLLSTVSVYGKITDKVLHENTKRKNVNAYGVSKFKMEKMLIDYCKKNKINFLILRLPGVVGNFQSDVNFMNNLVKKFSNDEVVKFNNPNNYFNNIIHTESISKISENFMLGDKNKCKNKIFNLASLKPIKLKDLISQIKRKFKSKSIVKILEPNNSFMISTKKSEKYEIPLITTSKCIEKNIKFILKFDC
jgi:nucleoside-diphosphate-sugar epimerase